MEEAAEKDANVASRLLFRRLFAEALRVFVIGDVMSYESDKAAECLNHHRATLTSGRTDEWRSALPFSNLFSFILCSLFPFLDFFSSSLFAR